MNSEPISKYPIEWILNQFLNVSHNEFWTHSNISQNEFWTHSNILNPFKNISKNEFWTNFKMSHIMISEPIKISHRMNSEPIKISHTMISEPISRFLIEGILIFDFSQNELWVHRKSFLRNNSEPFTGWIPKPFEEFFRINSQLMNSEPISRVITEWNLTPGQEPSQIE